MFNPEFLDNNIGYFTDAVSEPALLIKFIEEIEKNDNITDWFEWETRENAPIFGVRRKMTGVNIQEADPRTLYIYNSLFSGLKFCADMYKKMKNIETTCEISQELVINKYQTQIGMGQHTDVDPNNTGLHYSLMMFLNDDYEGGEVVFSQQKITLKPKPGSVLIFPSDEPYFHGSNELISGDKYVIPAHWFKADIARS